jgi:hypothetical protein
LRSIVKVLFTLGPTAQATLVGVNEGIKGIKIKEEKINKSCHIVCRGFEQCDTRFRTLKHQNWDAKPDPKIHSDCDSYGKLPGRYFLPL